jgi:hypothetical protein
MKNFAEGARPCPNLPYQRWLHGLLDRKQFSERWRWKRCLLTGCRRGIRTSQ